jgi:hypothetical protein
VHANKLQPYEVRVDALQCDSLCYVNDDCDATNVTVNNCATVYENDSELGTIPIMESASLQQAIWCGP